MTVQKEPTSPDWNRFARDAAEDANTSCFSSRRCVFEYAEHAGVLALCNNNPYADDVDRRPKEETLLRQHFAARGIAELAYATFPTEGAEAGYTTAMVIGPLPHNVGARWVQDAWEAVVAGREFEAHSPLDLLAEAVGDDLHK